MMGERDELWVRVLAGGGPDNDGPAKWCTLSALADALRPLLAQPEQPDAAPSIPAPDWSTAPDWANWWAVDSKGWAYWHDQKPYISEYKGWWTSTGQQEADTDKAVSADYPAWRDSLTQRPAATVPTDAALRARVAELRAADAQQAAAEWKSLYLVADRQRTELRERVAALTAERDDANADSALIVYELAEARKERDELAAKWARVPWHLLERITPHPWRDWQPVREWIIANRPAATD